ncbi:MAG: lasso peptide biosynthesis B2 protein [Limnoraphis sp. WC205]|jgi:hypothetical protein|nr:lasso peptide biosynthesis B2 protein [Limnoraphis sp. WC205]
MKQLYKLLCLSPDERQLLLVAYLWLGLVRFMMWLLPFKTWRKLVTQISQATSNPQRVSQVCVSKIVWAVNLSSRYMPGGVKCLARALTMQILMGQYGYSSELRIGVAKEKEGQFVAHAWVESQGQVIIGNLTDLSRFTPLSSVVGEGL